jgi:hypothetical protein
MIRVSSLSASRQWKEFLDDEDGACTDCEERPWKNESNNFCRISSCPAGVLSR